MGAAHPMRRRRTGGESWFGGGGQAVDDALAMAGTSRDGLDVVELYDPFSIVTLCLLEEYGFCEAARRASSSAVAGSRPAASCRSTPAAASCPASTSRA